MQYPQSLPCNFKAWRCVVDPLLTFTKYGAPLVKQLSSGVEVWIARELWHILNNVNFYLQQPGLLNPAVIFSPPQIDQEYSLLQETLISLQQWEQLRIATDLSRLHLFWLGDSLKESFLPRTIETNLFENWEAIAHSLDHHLNQHQVEEHILYLTFRDTISLTVSLDSAFILTCQPKSSANGQSMPEICQVLEAWGIACHAISPEDPMVYHERELLREVFVSANISKFLWGNLRLAVLHLLAPNTFSIQQRINCGPIDSSIELNDTDTSQEYTEKLWADTRGLWYFL